MSGSSGWCLDRQHTACRFLDCTCDCHRAEQGRVLASRRDEGGVR